MSPEQFRNLTTGQKRKLQLAKLVSLDVKRTVIDELSALEVKVDEQRQDVAQRMANIYSEVENIKKMQGPKGDKGEKGDKGDIGENGKDGKGGREGKDGKDGLNGTNGNNGKDGVDGIDGKDADEESIVSKIENELPALGARIRDGLELLQGEERLDASAIKNLPEATKEVVTKAGWGAHPLLIQDDGATVDKNARIINFTGATITRSGQGVINVPVGGGGGGIPQYDTDPASPTAEDAWVLRSTTGTGGGKLNTFLGLGFPYTSQGTLSYTYRLSYRTQAGTTVRTLLS